MTNIARRAAPHSVVALCLGGARSVWADYAAARALVGDRPHIVVACNVAGSRFPGHLDGYASLHPDFLANWMRKRVRNGGNEPRLFGPAPHSESPTIEVVAPRWDASSALFAAQIAMKQLKAGKVILCGAPLDREAGSIAIPGRWDDPERYRAGFITALPEIEHKVRSMGGWTAALIGSPTPDWLASRA